MKRYFTGTARIHPALNSAWRGSVRKKLSFGVACLVTAGLEIQVTHAQTPPGASQQSDSGTANIGTIPITAPAIGGGYASPNVSFGPFGDTRWQDVPFRTFSVLQQVIQDQQAHTPYEMLRNDPSVTINFSPTFTPAGSYTIRGFTVDDFDMKLDGLPIWTGSAVNGFSVAPEGLERVDVLTGAGAALYGFAAPAGVINFVTKKPLDTPLTNVTLQYNSRLNPASFSPIL